MSEPENPAALAAASHHASTLVADLGGTNVRFALAQTSAARPLLDASIRHYAVADFASLTDAARHYLAETGAQPQRGVFAVAGRVQGNEVRITNHPWVISTSQTREALGLKSLRIVNDFAGMSMSVPLLGAADVEAIGTAVPESSLAAPSCTIGVLGPGTGLGVGAFLRRDGAPQILETEGGHVGFAPSNELEIEILRRLSQRYGRVSNERLICGSGLVNLYATLCEIAGVAAETLSPAQITARAQARSDAQCGQAIATFCDILGTIAGDLVLAIGAWDGIYLAGGIVPPLLPWLREGEFRHRFEAKGRFAEAMQRVPTVAITYAYAGLLGAAAMAVVDGGGQLAARVAA